MILRWSSLLLGLAMLTGCAGLNRPATYVYPMAGQSPGQQADDSETCERWARQQTGYDAAGAAISGAVTGILIGAALGAIVGAIICAPIHASGECAGWLALGGAAITAPRGAAYNIDARRAQFTRTFEVCAMAKGYATGDLILVAAPGTASTCLDKDNALGVWDARVGFCRVPPRPPPPPPPPPGFAPALPLPLPTPAWDTGL
jgi:hypothetical protein